MTPTLDEATVAHFGRFGFAVLRRVFEPAALGAEIDWALAVGLVPLAAPRRFDYIPLTTGETPRSLALLDALAEPARALLAEPGEAAAAALATRAKGVRYRGDTGWHEDTDGPVRSVGFLAYLEPLTAADGALRVLPGSHLSPLRDAARAHVARFGDGVDALPGHVLEVAPGDVVAMDERLFHASAGGGVRRQWRCDYVRDAVDPAGERALRDYFAKIYAPGWACGYDPARFPSYGPTWRAAPRAGAERLEDLGVLALAEAQESPVRRG